MATTGVPSTLYESNDAPDLVNGAFAKHTHELGKIESGSSLRYAGTLSPGSTGDTVGLFFPGDPDYPSDTTQLAVLTYEFSLPDGVMFNGFSIGSEGDGTILWVKAKNTTSSPVNTRDCGLRATVMFIRG